MTFCRIAKSTNFDVFCYIFLDNPIDYRMMTLEKCKKSHTYKIEGFVGETDPVMRRFMELGFSKGEKIKIVSTSLQKKVFLIEIRGYLLSVRASLLNRVQVSE